MEECLHFLRIFQFVANFASQEIGVRCGVPCETGGVGDQLGPSSK